MTRAGDILLRHIAPKLLALLLAVTIWYALRQITSNEILIEDVPIEFKVEDGLAALQPSSETVDVYFQGSQDDLRLLDRKQIKVSLTLMRLTGNGETEVLIHPQDVKGAGAARPLRVLPNLVRVSLDRKVEKQVPVKARQAGKPLQGEVQEMACDPLSVKVRGPAQYVNALEWLFTEPVDVDGRIATFTRTSRVVRPEGGWAAVLEPAEVRVTVKILETLETRDMPEVPVQVLIKPGSLHKATLTPGRVNLKLTGKAEALDKVFQTKPRVFADCADLDLGMPYDIPLTVSLPPGLNVTAVTDPKFIRVLLEMP